MKKNIQPDLASIAAFVGCVLLTSSVFAQQESSGYSPGSTDGQPFSLLKESSVAESWIPPATDVQTAPSVWAPPTTPAVSPPQVSPPQVSPPQVGPTEVGPVVVQESVPALNLSVTEPELIVPPTEASPTIASPLASALSPPTPAVPAVQNSLLSPANDVPVIPPLTQFDGSDVSTLEPFEVGDAIERSVITEDFDSSQPPAIAESIDPMVANRIGSGDPILGQVPANLPTPARNILRGVNSRLAGNGDVYAVGQLTLLSLSRDYRGKGRILSNGAPNLLANGPDEGDFTGVDISYGRRRAGGEGWEMRYLGFNPDQATDVSGSGPSLVWGGLAPPLNDPATWGGTIPVGIPETFGLSGIGLGGFSMGDLFEDANNHRVSRDSEFGSFEFNFLRASAGGRRLSCGNAMVEFFGGLRGVSFQETTTFTAASTQSAVFPRSAFYASEVQNSLFGLQIGGRLERQRKNGWSTSFGSRVGIYNNRIESRQHAKYQFDDGSTATPQVLFGSNAGRDFDFSGTDNELAFLGELDFGLIYQFRQRTRARVGFRGIAVTNIADSAGQLEDSLFDTDKVAEPNVWGDLIVGGFYFGVDHAF